VDTKRLQELRAEHRPVPWQTTNTCSHELCFGLWPCEDSQILDVALEAEETWQKLVTAELEVERLRTAVELHIYVLEKWYSDKRAKNDAHDLRVALTGKGQTMAQQNQERLAGTEASP